MLSPITAWLDAPDDYSIGLALLEQTGFAGYALTVLRLGDDAYNRKRLVQELSAWLNRQKPVATLSTEVVAPVVAQPVEVITNKEVAGVDQLINSINQQIYPLMDERATLKSQIWTVQDDDARHGDRRDWAYLIKQITRDIDALYAQIDFVKQYGYLPPNEASPIEVDDATLLMNVRTYVSRYRKKLKDLVGKGAKPDDPRFCATEKLLTQYLDQKNQLELKLSKNNDSHPTRQQTATADR